jgi:hypothetical protein
MVDRPEAEALFDVCLWLAATPAAVVTRVVTSISAELTPPQVLWEALNWAQRAAESDITRRIAIRAAADKAYASAFMKTLIVANDGTHRRTT